VHKDAEIRRLHDQLQRQRRETDVRVLVESAILLMPPTYVEGLPVASLLLYECLHRWRSFDPHARHLNTPSFTTVTSGFLSAASRGDENLYHCLASAATLFLITQQEFSVFDFDLEEVNDMSQEVHRHRRASRPLSRRADDTTPLATSDSPAAVFVRGLQATVVQLYKDLLARVFLALPRDLVLETLFNVDCVDGVPSTAALKKEHPIDRILGVFNATLAFCDAHHLPMELRAQLFAQLYLYLTVTATNALLDHPKLCSAGFGIALKQKAVALGRWAAAADRSGLKTFAKTSPQLKEIATIFILTNKEQLLSAETRRDICPTLSEDLIARLLENYTPDEYDAVGFPYARVRALKYRANAAGCCQTLKADPAAISTPSLWSSCLRQDAGRGTDGHSQWARVLARNPHLIPRDLRENPAFAFLGQ